MMQNFQQILNDAEAQEKTKMGELDIETRKLKSMIGIYDLITLFHTL